METAAFTVDQRKELSEDRVQFHVNATYMMKPSVERKFEKRLHSNILPGGNEWGLLRQARFIQNKPLKMTVLYERHGQDNWTIANAQQGYR